MTIQRQPKKLQAIIKTHTIKAVHLFRYLLLAALFLNPFAYAQIDREKLDSLARSIDSSARQYRNWQDSFAKVQDSIYHAGINHPGKTADQSTGRLQRVEKERRLVLLCLVIGTGLLAVVVLLLRRRNKS